MLLDYVKESCDVKDALRVLTSEYETEKRMFTTDIYACRALVLFSENVLKENQSLIHIPQIEIPGVDASLDDLLSGLKGMFNGNKEAYLSYSSFYPEGTHFSDIDKALRKHLGIEAMYHRSEKPIFDLFFDAHKRVICETILENIAKSPEEYARELERAEIMLNTGKHMFILAKSPIYAVH